MMHIIPLFKLRMGLGLLAIALATFFTANVSFAQTNSFRAATNFDVGLKPTSVAIADLNGDAKFDIAVANGSSANVSVLLNNTTDDIFTLIENVGGIADTTADAGSWGYYDDDEFPDLFIANRSGEKFLFQHAGINGSFTRKNLLNDVSNSRGSCCGDFDNDGDLDLFVANDFNTDNFVYLNNGNDPFRIAGNRIDLLEGGGSIGGSWGNYDHDGDLDLLLVTQPTQDNFLYENTLSQTGTAALNLKDPANDSAPDPFPMNSDGGNSWGCSWADYDNDGDLDLLTANHEGPVRNFLYRNNLANGNSWINIRLKGTVSNRSASGAKVRILADIAGTGMLVWQMQELLGQSGIGSQNSLNAEFGLGQATIVDQIRVEWPSGIVQVINNGDPSTVINSLVIIEEDEFLANTQESSGQSVTVIPQDETSGSSPVEVLFPDVTRTGQMRLSTSSTGPAPSDGFSIFPFADPIYYNLSTTAGFNGLITITISYDETLLGGIPEESLQLRHFDNGDFVDITTSRDLVQNTITGQASHFSTFAIMSSQIIVSNTNDSGPGSLREAIGTANSTAGPDTISFNIPGGPYTIQPLSALPTITESVIIDATTQPGFTGQPIVEIDGGGASVRGLNIRTDNCIIKGFAIRGFAWGIFISGTAAHDNKIEGNFIVANAGGIAITLGATNNIIGGTTPASRNVISGNQNQGVSIVHSNTNGNQIVGNYIGIDETGTELGNGAAGIQVLNASTGTIIGGLAGKRRQHHFKQRYEWYRALRLHCYRGLW